MVLQIKCAWVEAIEFFFEVTDPQMWFKTFVCVRIFTFEGSCD